MQEASLLGMVVRTSTEEAEAMELPQAWGQAGQHKQVPGCQGYIVSLSLPLKQNKTNLTKNITISKKNSMKC